MQGKKSKFLLDVYSKESILINNINFTPREIDVMACLLNARGTSKTAYFLKISPKTVRRNIENLRLKLGCNSREGIIDFIEQYNKQSLLRTHYLNLLVDEDFKKSLKKISKITAITCLCSLVFWNKEEYTLLFFKTLKIFLETLKGHLVLAGIKTTIKIEITENVKTYLNDQAKDESYSVYILPKRLRDIEKNDSDGINIKNAISQNSLFLMIENEGCQKTPNNLYGIDCFDFTESKNYYFSFFDILKKLLPHSNIENISEEFKRQYKLTNESDDVKNLPKDTSVEKESSPTPIILTNKIKYFLIGIISILSIYCILLFFFKGDSSEEFTYPYFTKKKSGITIRSDLILPSGTTVLNRPELILQIDNKFKNQGGGIQSVAIVGIGGAGKTTLARQYAHLQKANVTWEVNAETNSSLRKSFGKLAHSLSKTEQDQKILRTLQEIKNSTEREEQLINFVKERLKLQSPWFIIFDNVEKFSDIQRYFPQDSHTWGEGKILLTTRNSNIQTNSQVDGIILIGELSPHQKFSLFVQIMNHGENYKLTATQQNEAKEFLKPLPPFPLDVSIAAYYLKTANISYAKYLENLDQQDKNFTDVQENLLKEAGEYAKTRYSIVTLSLKNLINVHKDFGDLLLLISLLDSQNIPKDLLDYYKNNLVVDNFIYYLKKYSLITNASYDSSNVATSFSLHRSTQKIILSYFSKELNLGNNKKILTSILLTLENYINPIIYKEDIYKMRLLFSHLNSIMLHSDLLTDTIRGSISSMLGSMHSCLGDYIKSIDYLTNGLLIFNAFDKNNYRIASILARLADVFHEIGDYEQAKIAFEKSISLKKNYYPKNHNQISRTSANLGDLYREIGNYEQSRYLLEKSLDMYIKSPSKDHLGIAFVLLYLGNLEQDLGNYEKSKDLFNKSFIICKNYLPGEHFVVSAWALASLGNIHRELGDYKKSKNLIDQSIIICKKNLSENHVGFGMILIHLGNIHMASGNYKEAERIFEKSLNIFKSHYKYNHIRICQSLRGLGKVALLKNNIKAAEYFYYKVLEAFKSNKNIKIYSALEDLAELYALKAIFEADKGNSQLSQTFKKQAIQYLNKALEIVETCFPKNSPHLVRIQNMVNELLDQERK